MNKEFAAAPWGFRVKLITLGLVGLLVVLPTLFLLVIPRIELWVAGLAGGLPASIVGITALFVVRGFRIAGDTLYVRRSFWETAVSLAGLRSAVADPRACAGAWKTVGNDGLFAMHGWFRSKKLGRFRAFVTDPACAVVLAFPDRTLVISPAKPRVLVNALRCRPGQPEDRS